jgi:4-amino-4-deoxy-L-arabinose transferase-like glycosyltransferase
LSVNRPAITAGGLAVVAFLVYAPTLASVPGSLHPDELTLARQAYSIAQTGRDLDGRLLPLFIHRDNELWFPALPVYAAAAAITILPSSPVAVRWASVVFGVLGVVLIYGLGRRFFPDARGSIRPVAILLFVPVYYMLTRAAVDAVYATPFVLGSIICVLSFLETTRLRRLAAAGALLGAGFYSQTAAPIMMASYLGVCLLALWVGHQRALRVWAWLIGSFAVMLVPAVAWLLVHPEAYPDTLGRWAIHAAHLRNPQDGLRALLNWGSLTNRASVYWEFLNPAFLFFPARLDTLSLTRGSGPLPFTILLLLPFGVHRIVRHSRPATSVLLLVGLLAAPLAAATFGENHAIDRALPLAPLMALVAAFGVDALASTGRPVWRAVAGVLFLLIPVQFAVFGVDYLSRYRVETMAWPGPSAESRPFGGSTGSPSLRAESRGGQLTVVPSAVERRKLKAESSASSHERRRPVVLALLHDLERALTVRLVERRRHRPLG